MLSMADCIILMPETTLFVHSIADGNWLPFERTREILAPSRKIGQYLVRSSIGVQGPPDQYR